MKGFNDAELSRVLSALGIGSDELLGQGDKSFVFSLDNERIARVNRSGTSQAKVAGRTELLSELGHSSGRVPFAIPVLLDTEVIEGHIVTGDEVTALNQVEAVLEFLQSGGNLQGTENTLRIYLTCVQVLRATNDPRAEEFLEVTYRFLQERAAKISDKIARRIFLEHIPWHREIVALWDSQ